MPASRIGVWTNRPHIAEPYPSRRYRPSRGVHPAGLDDCRLPNCLKFAAHFDLTAQLFSTSPDRLSVAIFHGSLRRKGLGKFTTNAVDASQEPHYLRFVGTGTFPTGKEKARLGLIRRAYSFFSL